MLKTMNFASPWLCLFGALLVVPNALAQSPDGVGYSYISIDPGSGNITVVGITQVWDNEGFEDWKTASVYTSASFGGSDSEVDNCGDGCAQSTVYGQVSQPGATYSEYSGHDGWLYYDEDAPWEYSNTSGDTYSVPGAPAISLQSINAVSPHSAYWNYYISGILPYSVTMSLGNNVNIQTPSNNYITFTLDQDNYPDTSWPPDSQYAFVNGSMYGVSFSTPACYVTYTKNMVMTGSQTMVQYDGGDLQGGIPQFISVEHDSWYRFNTVQYCIQPDPGSALTELTQAQGTIDTSNNDPTADTTLAAVGEANIHQGQNDTLGPIYFSTYPPQSDQHQSREMWYGWSPGPGATVGPSEWFLPASVQGQICNTVLVIESSGGSGFPLNSGSCISQSWP